MKKYTLHALLAIPLVLIALVLFAPDKVRSATGFLFLGAQSGAATTTRASLTPGTGTTTVPWNTSEANQNAIYLQLEASTTDATLDWYYEFSNNNIDWYNEDQTSLTTGVANAQQTFQHSSTTVTHRWSPGNSNSTTTRKALVLPDYPARYTRAVFTIPVGIGSTNALLHVESWKKAAGY